MYPELIEFTETHEIWEFNGKRLYHEKQYSLTLQRYSCGRYTFENDFYQLNYSSWKTAYTVKGLPPHSNNDYMSLQDWCIAVGFWSKE